MTQRKQVSKGRRFNLPPVPRNAVERFLTMPLPTTKPSGGTQP